MLFFILYKIGEFLALSLPVSVSYKVAVFLSDIKYFLSPVERREMAVNMRCVLPGETEKTARKYARRIFINFSKYLVDFFRFKKISECYIEGHVKIEGEEYLTRSLEKGKGVIFLTAHIGNWELGGAVIGVIGYPMNVVALDHKNRLVNDFFINQRRMKNERVISIKFAVRKCLAALANNECVALLGDKDFTNNGVVVKFFGRDTLLPKGAAAMSLRTGADILPGYMVRLGEADNFKLFFEKPVEYSPGGDFEKDVRRLTQLCAGRMESCIRRYPTQWYCFKRFWL